MTQLSWLGHSEPSPQAIDLARIVGLKFVPDFVSAEEEQRLLALLDSEKWSSELRRRVQHYGYRYDYRKRDISRDDYLGPLPDWAAALGQKLINAGLFVSLPDQVIANEYLPGQGIAPHIDRTTCFGEVVGSLSLASPTVMDFTNDRDSIALPLPRRSFVALSGPARYSWKHGIAARQSDDVDGVPRERERRVSLTFRTLIIAPLSLPEQKTNQT